MAQEYRGVGRASILMIQERRTPPGSNDSGRLRFNVDLEMRRRRRVHGRGRIHVVAELGLTIFFRVRTRLRTALLAAVTVVRLHVLRQVVGAHETLIADWAGEPFLARVRAQVSL